MGIRSTTPERSASQEPTSLFKENTFQFWKDGNSSPHSFCNQPRLSPLFQQLIFGSLRMTVFLSLFAFLAMCMFQLSYVRACSCALAQARVLALQWPAWLVPYPLIMYICFDFVPENIMVARSYCYRIHFSRFDAFLRAVTTESCNISILICRIAKFVCIQIVFTIFFCSRRSYSLVRSTVSSTI